MKLSVIIPARDDVESMAIRSAPGVERLVLRPRCGQGDHCCVAEWAVPALRRPSPATGVLLLLLLAAAAVLLYAGRHLTFFFDEWSWILGRRGGGSGTFLDPYNGHFSLFPIAVYKLLFATVALRHYTPYRVVGVALHLLCCVLLYILVRRRVGPWLALVPTALLLFMGTASQDLLWPFQIGFFSSVAGGLGALALIEDGRSDVLACLLLVWSIVSSAIGIPFPHRRRRGAPGQTRSVVAPVDGRRAGGRVRDLVSGLGVIAVTARHHRFIARSARVRGRGGRRRGPGDRRPGPAVGAGVGGGDGRGVHAVLASERPRAPHANAAGGDRRCPRVLDPDRAAARRSARIRPLAAICMLAPSLSG